MSLGINFFINGKSGGNLVIPLKLVVKVLVFGVIVLLYLRVSFLKGGLTCESVSTGFWFSCCRVFHA